MCNAWNHSPGCTCGWGGDGHAGYSGFSSFDTFTARDTSHWWVPSLTSTYAGYVNPNASCPVCGAPVFFYQSPSGGRVFFDELGPPWPKHPCTDNSSRPGRPLLVDAGLPSAPPLQKAYAWQHDGWQPFFIRSIIGIDKNFLKVSGSVGEVSIGFYLQRLVEHHLHDDSLSERSLAQLKTTSDATYQLSILLPNAVPITVNAFMVLADARAELVQRRHAKQAKAPAGRFLSSRTAHELTQTRSGAGGSGLNRDPLDTTMAQAFRQARQRHRQP